MDKSLERYKLPKLTQEEIDNMNSPIFIKEIKFIIKKLLTKITPQNSRPSDFAGEFYQTVKKERIAILHKLF